MIGGTVARFSFDDLPRDTNLERYLSVMAGVFGEAGKIIVLREAYNIGKALQMY